MRSALSLIVIVFATVSLLGGFFSGRAAVPHVTLPTPAAPESQNAVPLDVSPQIAQGDEVADDDFSGDAAVASDAGKRDPHDDAHLAFSLVDAGHSVALESPFLSYGVPVTVVIDPDGPAAVEMSSLAVKHGDAVYVQARAPLSAASVRAAQMRGLSADGVAVRLESERDVPADALSALRAAHLSLFDEYGEDAAVASHVTAAGVRYASRTITVDDHLQRTYVAYMLSQAVRFGRGRTAVVMARPFPGTLQAFQDLLTHASRDGIYFVGLPQDGR